jgi:Domain of unknown function (DUF1906)
VTLLYSRPMRTVATVSLFSVLLCSIVVLTLTTTNPPPTPSAPPPHSYVGFDLNEYPGDAALPILRKSFSFSSYWLGPAPGEKQSTSTWAGKRATMKAQGFGFIVLFNGRETKNLKNAEDARQKGILDSHTAAKSAEREGFPKGTIIFLDIEEGGRLPAPYHAYLLKWQQSLYQSGYRPGVYCSAMPVNEGHGVTITTAQDIKAHMANHELAFWVFNDACPPSPGCAFQPNLPPTQSGFSSASVWQYAQSPRRKQFTEQCPAKYASDGNCYAPGDTAHKWFLDANIASSPDPSSAN